MRSNHNFARILAFMAAVAMLLSARADASSVVREGDDEDGDGAKLKQHEWHEYQARLQDGKI